MGVCVFIKLHRGSSLVAQWIGFSAFTAVARVQFLVWDLRSHIKPLNAVAEKKKKKTELNYP